MMLKKGDSVKIITGKDSGKVAKVLRVLRKENKIMVENSAMKVKHVKPRKGGEKGQRISTPGFIDASNAMIMCGSCGKPARIGIKLVGASKQRVCKRCTASLS